MPKLWIVHRSAQQRISLARLSGLAESDRLSGAPNEPGFASASAPSALLLGLEGDFEDELDFVYRHRTKLARTRCLLLANPVDAEEAERLFRAIRPEIQKNPPSAQIIRDFIGAALSRRDTPSLTERQHRHRISERFAVWLGNHEVPGLLRALDPSLASLPLLIRGVSGSGRSLLRHYIESFRGSQRHVLRLEQRDLFSAETLGQRLLETEAVAAPPRSVWLNEIDSFSISEQRTLAEMIMQGSPEIDLDTTLLRWIATAGPTGLDGRLEHAFAPLTIEIPSLLEHPETLDAFVKEVAKDWTRSVGGERKKFTSSALASLKAHPWTGDRAELEAVLRKSLAASNRKELEDVDLRFPTDTAAWHQTATPLSPPPPTVPGSLAAASPWLPTPIDRFENLIEVGEGEALASPLKRDLVEAVDLVETVSERKNEPARLDQAPDSEQNLGWRRLARSLSHEIRNPLVSIRTFAELLPDHFDDETFRTSFTELVSRDVAQLGDVLNRLSSIAERESFEAEAVDVSSLIQALLEQRQEQFQRGQLVVRREFERDAPFAWADPGGLELALAGLLDHALKTLPEGGDLFVSTQALDRGIEGRGRLRVLFRHQNAQPRHLGDSPLAELDPGANVLEYALAETVVSAFGGSLTIDTTANRESLIQVDLPVPA